MNSAQYFGLNTTTNKKILCEIHSIITFTAYDNDSVSYFTNEIKVSVFFCVRVVERQADDENKKYVLSRVGPHFFLFIKMNDDFYFS